MEENKVILLDIDSVLSPLFYTEKESVVIDIEWAIFKIPLETISFIREIAREVKVVWSSSWEEDSYKASKLLDIDIKEHITFQSNSNEWFKIEPLIRYIKENKDKDILILDDEIFEFSSHFDKFSNVTLISPTDSKGLSNEDFINIKGWINNKNF